MNISIYHFSNIHCQWFCSEVLNVEYLKKKDAVAHPVDFANDLASGLINGQFYYYLRIFRVMHVPSKQEDHHGNSPVQCFALCHKRQSNNYCTRYYESLD